MSDEGEDGSDIGKLLEMRQALLAELHNGDISTNDISIDFGDESTNLVSDNNENNDNGTSRDVDTLDDMDFDGNEAVEENDSVISDDSFFNRNECMGEDVDDRNVKNVEEIDELLEKPVGDVPDHLKNASRRFKRVLMYRGTDHFDVLPDGWVEVTHSSGLPVYLHKKTRCCTFSRPYFLGPGSVRHHQVPQSAIPCYFYRKLCEEAENRADKNDQETNHFLNGGVSSNAVEKRNEILDKLNAPGIKIKTADDIKYSQFTPDSLHEYAKKRIKFKNISVYRFGEWQEARTFYKNRKRAGLSYDPTLTEDGHVANTSRPGLPSNLVLITVPSMDNLTKPQQKGFYLNPQGKTSVSVLHELIQKILRCTVCYSFSETRNSTTPYHCVAKIATNNTTNKIITGSSIKDKLTCLKERYRLQEQGDEYITVGEGCGNSKKHAKLMAAKKSVENLFSGIEFDDNGMAISHKGDAGSADNSTTKISSHQMEENKFQIFDNLAVCDSRVAEWSAKAGQPAPYIILQEYLKRNAAFGDTGISTKIYRVQFKKHQFDMTVGRHRVVVDCANKREGKQKAAQEMLRKFLPQNTTWGSILRLYGYEAQQKQKEAIKNKESIIKLQGEVRMQNENNCNTIEPNTVILDKLKSEMMKMSENLIGKKFARLNSSNISSQSNTSSGNKRGENGVCPMKRSCLQFSASTPTLSSLQIQALEELLNSHKRKLRDEEINFSDLPILTESQMRELSAKLGQLFPDKDIQVPSLF